MGKILSHCRKHLAEYFILLARLVAVASFFFYLWCYFIIVEALD